MWNIHVDSSTLEVYGPVCVMFRWDIAKQDVIYDWMLDTYPNDSEERIKLDCSRMIRRPIYWAFFTGVRDAMRFMIEMEGRDGYVEDV